MRENFLDRAIMPVTKAYLDTMAFLEQSQAFESGGIVHGSSAESYDDSDFVEPKQMHTAQSTAQQPLLPPPVMELNIINAEITGKTVRVSALMDIEGLEKLEKKIAALKDFLKD